MNESAKDILLVLISLPQDGPDTTSLPCPHITSPSLNEPHRQPSLPKPHALPTAGGQTSVRIHIFINN
jgi:hypothetical protein